MDLQTVLETVFVKTAKFPCPDGAFVSRLQPKTSGVAGLSTVVTGSLRSEFSEGTLAVWDVKPSDYDDRSLNITLRAKQSYPSSIWEMQFVNETTVLSGDGRGVVQAWKLDDSGNESNPFKSLAVLEGRHTGASRVGAPLVTGIAVDVKNGEGVVASVGEDGHLFYYLIGHQGARLVSHRVTPCGISYSSVAHVAMPVVVTGTINGTVELWDLREHLPTTTFGLPVSLTGAWVMSVDTCQSAPHIVVGGITNGAVAFWDMRKPALPLTTFRAHDACVVSVKFHPDRVHEVISCSIENGGGLRSTRVPLCGDYPYDWFGGSAVAECERPCDIGNNVLKRILDESNIGGGFKTLDVKRNMLVGTLLDNSVFVAVMAEKSEME